MNEIIKGMLTGRCIGHNRDAGRIVHLLRNAECTGPSFRPALCGVRPGEQSAGWNEECEDRTATCPRCIARFAKLRYRLFAVNATGRRRPVEITDPKQPPLTYQEAEVMLSKQSVYPGRHFEAREVHE